MKKLASLLTVFSFGVFAAGCNETATDSAPSPDAAPAVEGGSGGPAGDMADEGMNEDIPPATDEAPPATDEAAPIETPAPAETPAETPAEEPAPATETPAEGDAAAPGDTPAESAETPAETPAEGETPANPQ